MPFRNVMSMRRLLRGKASLTLSEIKTAVVGFRWCWNCFSWEMSGRHGPHAHWSRTHSITYFVRLITITTVDGFPFSSIVKSVEHRRHRNWYLWFFDRTRICAIEICYLLLQPKSLQKQLGSTKLRNRTVIFLLILSLISINWNMQLIYVITKIVEQVIPDMIFNSKQICQLPQSFTKCSLELA